MGHRLRRTAQCTELGTLPKPFLITMIHTYHLAQSMHRITGHTRLAHHYTSPQKGPMDIPFWGVQAFRSKGSRKSEDTVSGQLLMVAGMALLK